ncbi:MAG: LysM peptidoglycan-binding domain-containing protein [Opitutaceae bacterium]
MSPDIRPRSGCRFIRLIALGCVVLNGLPLAALTHSVRKGETLSSIASQYGVDVASLARENRLGDADLVKVGQRLEIPTGATPFQEYRVRKGDSLGSIATRFGVSAREISKANNLRDADFVQAGQTLRIPNPRFAGATYTVTKGDSLASIASRFNIPVNDLATANALRNADLLQIGQVLAIPGGGTSDPAKNTGDAGSGVATSPSSTPSAAYTVQKGDVLAEIADEQGVPVSVIVEANNLDNANLLQVGQTLIIPGGEPEPARPESTSPSTPAIQASTYTVKKGDNLASIAARQGVSVGAIARANDLRDTNLLVVGQELTIPSGHERTTAYTVRKGDSLGSIAARHRISVSDILAANRLARPDRIVPGQVLLLPSDAIAPPPPPKTVYPVIPSSVQRRMDAVKVKPGQWQHIVIHHSGTPIGSGKNIDRYHREERHMENGLAYHFVIGNGNGMRDGEIYIGGRWIKQIEGGHLAIHALNLNSIGICLIGNFEKDRPTTKQLNSLEALIRTLLAETGLPRSAVTTHKEIHPKHTLCPGRQFPTEAFEARLSK